MKKTKLLHLLIVCIFGFALDTQAQIDTPRPSPAGGVSATVGLTKIDISYFRPQIKGRKIFGEGTDFLVPYNKLWRAGANAGTVVTISDNVKVVGNDLAAGKYLLLATPGAADWSVVFYNDISMGGHVDDFDPAKAALTVSVKSSKLSETVSTLTYNITDVSANSESANIQLAWENTAVNIPISVSFDDIVMKSIASNMEVNPRNYTIAARYYYTTDKDLDQALTWMNSYLAMGKNNEQFWHILLKAQILVKKGNKKEALKTAMLGMKVAKNAPADFGYIKSYEELIASIK